MAKKATVKTAGSSAKAAAQKSNTKVFEFSKLNDFLSKEVNPIGSLVETNEFINTKEFISSGIYVLDAALSTKLVGGGIPNNKVVGIGGESGTGKTYLCLNFAKAAQKQDYYVIYLDSENAIDLNLCNKFGIDTSKFRIDPIATVEDLKVYLAKFIKKMQDMKNEGYELPKVLLVLDSLGNLASNKEVNDAESGNEKADMTRAKQLKSIFRIVTQKLGTLSIPLLLSNHSYFCAKFNTLVTMGDGDLKEIKDIKIGDFVQTLEGPKEVEEVYSFDNAPTLKIELEDGKIIEVTPNHKFLIKPEWSNDETDECWKEAEELQSGDIILSTELISELV
jgi:RecA/RadA recombinase